MQNVLLKILYIFVMFGYFVTHCDLEWFYSPCLSVAAIFFFFSFFYYYDYYYLTVLIIRRQLLKFLHVMSGSPCLCRWLSITADILVAYIAFAWLCQITTSVLIRKCYKSSWKSLCITPHSKTPVLWSCLSRSVTF